jgi:hypothetical protein
MHETVEYLQAYTSILFTFNNILTFLDQNLTSWEIYLVVSVYGNNSGHAMYGIMGLNPTLDVYLYPCGCMCGTELAGVLQNI